MMIQPDDLEWIKSTIAHRRIFYHHASATSYWLWQLSRAVSILAAATSALLAATMHEGTSVTLSLKILVVSFASLATVSSTFLAVFRWGDFYAIYEEGLISVRYLENQARTFFSANHAEEQRLAYMESVDAALAKIENDQLALKRKIPGGLGH